MKKLVVFALLLGAAGSAFAQEYLKPFTGPANKYTCTYSNYTGPAVNGGKSYWDLSEGTDLSGKPMLVGIEFFDATHPRLGNYLENYRATWAKPEDLYSQDPWTGEWVLYGTRWEFTFKDGPQCKNTIVYTPNRFNLYRITFQNCTDGHSRTCTIRK